MKKTIILALALALMGTSAAFAHAHLLHETPADKAVVSPAPAALTLDFSEGVQLRFTGVTVTGPGKAAVKLGAAALDPHDDKVLTLPFAGPLAAGVYTVAWHALATDGHKTDGTYSFTVK